MIMGAITTVCLLVAESWTEGSPLLYFIPYTFLGNSLAPLPYDGAVVYLGARHALWLVVGIAIAATVLIEIWNMEVLTRILSREGARGFREHRVTKWTLRWYRKAPFWSLVATCVLPIIPHYPMRFLVVLAGYPQWKYQLTVILGRGMRYAVLAGIGVMVPIHPGWILLVSALAMALGFRGARKMNRVPSAGVASSTASLRSSRAMVEET